MTFSRYRTFFCALLLVSVLPTGVATAADGKSYPGTICQYWTAPASAQNARRGRMEVSQFGWVGNKAGASNRLGLVCPLIRDSMRSGIERVLVRASHPSCGNSTSNNASGKGLPCPGESRCTLRVMNGNADMVRNDGGGERDLVRINEPNASNASDTSAFMALNWQNVPVPDFTNAMDHTQGSTLVLFCRIAAGVRITSIYVGEGTD